MQLNELSILSSERGVRAALRSLFFGARSSLLTACGNIRNMNATVERLRRDGYQDRANAILETPRYVTLKNAVDQAAIRAASIDGYAQTLGHVIDSDFNPIMAGGKTKDQLAAVAEATGIDEAKLVEIERKGIKARYDREADAQTDAEVAFYSTEGADDLEIKAQTVLNAFERERNRMLEWANIDLGELVLLKHDIAMLERLVDYEEREVEPTEGSIDNDVAEQLSKPKALSAIYAEYQREIASVRENRLKEEALEAKAAAAGNPPVDKPKRSRITKAQHNATANA